jgi:hypothetical protein
MCRNRSGVGTEIQEKRGRDEEGILKKKIEFSVTNVSI